MPNKNNKPRRRRRGKRTNNLENKHFGRDDIVGRKSDDGSSANRRVSFKSKRRSDKELLRGLTLALDNDFPMEGTSDNNDSQIIVHGKNLSLPYAVVKNGHLSTQQTSFAKEIKHYKIVIPYGAKYTKDYILSNLNNISTEPFEPLMYKIVENEATFYVDNQKSAIALRQCDRKITTINGFKLRVITKAESPFCEIDDTLKQRVKQAMVKRYVQETNALDLSKFYLDRDLIEDYYFPLSRPYMMKAALDIVYEYLPTLEALNLDGNNLTKLDKLDVLYKQFPRLKILYIGDNKINNICQLNAIKELQLEELKLAGNPVLNKYISRKDDYISDVRKRFPKLLRLDGMELPRPILFDVVSDMTKVPPIQRLFVKDAKAQDIASLFLKEYFCIFDSEDRHPLLCAYDEHACFSLTVTNNFINTEKSSVYLPENRNLFRINNNNRRQTLLKQGRLSILSFIQQLPRTKHNLNTFTMDINIVTEKMMLITITGLFNESNDLLRYFDRTFIIVPRGSGFCICNEQLHISHPTEEQRKKFFTDNF